jgi:hypothetical protein
VTRRLPPLFRGFEDATWADDLASGRVWITTVVTCRKFEDQRGDVGEATLTYRSGAVQGDSTDSDLRTVAKRAGITFTGSPVRNIRIVDCIGETILPDAYLLCFSRKQFTKFGTHHVRIDDPRAFLIAVDRSLRQRGNVDRGQMRAVQYGEREYRHLEPGPKSIPAFTKPLRFIDEEEVRMLWTVNAAIEPFLLDCPEVRPYCTRLRD